VFDVSSVIVEPVGMPADGRRLKAMSCYQVRLKWIVAWYGEHERGRGIDRGDNNAMRMRGDIGCR